MLHESSCFTRSRIYSGDGKDAPDSHSAIYNCIEAYTSRLYNRGKFSFCYNLVNVSMLILSSRWLLLAEVLFVSRLSLKTNTSLF